MLRDGEILVKWTAALTAVQDYTVKLAFTGFQRIMRARWGYHRRDGRADGTSPLNSFVIRDGFKNELRQPA
jgi:hypothetical protein